MSITTNLLGLILALSLFFTGCGKNKKNFIPNSYPDSLTMFEKLYNSKNIDKHAPHEKNILSKIDIDKKLNRKDVEELINAADLSEIKQLINEGYSDRAKSKLRFIMQKYSDNPFVMLQCNFLYADILHKEGNTDWRNYMDNALKSYQKFSSNKNVQKVYSSSQDSMNFFQKFHPLNTSEAQQDVH